MEYAISWIIRFEGIITQGPNAGKSYTFASSWAGVRFDSEALARGRLADYMAKEPGLAFRLLTRQWIERRGWREVEIPI